MTKSIEKLIVLAAAAAVALTVSSCNTVSGLGQDLQNASSAVQNP